MTGCSIWDVFGLHAGLLLEPLHRQVPGRSGSPAAVAVLVRIRFHELDEPGQVMHRQIRAHQQQHPSHSCLRDRHEATSCFLRNGLDDGRCHHHAGCRCVENRVAVWRRLEDRVSPDHPAAPWPVLHDHSLLQRLGKALCHGPRQRVGSRSGRGRHDHLDRARGPGFLRLHRLWRAQGDACRRA
ncbi:hypothetical protein D3C81_1416140 [compost metagenome]